MRETTDISNEATTESTDRDRSTLQSCCNNLLGGEIYGRGPLLCASHFVDLKSPQSDPYPSYLLEGQLDLLKGPRSTPPPVGLGGSLGNLKTSKVHGGGAHEDGGGCYKVTLVTLACVMCMCMLHVLTWHVSAARV